MQRIGIFAPSSVVGQVELGVGVDFLTKAGFEVQVHQQVRAKHFTFAGRDEQRAEALFDLAHNKQVDIVWAARGGYGAQRLLPYLDDLTKKHGKPIRKLLIGYSDVTVLHEYVRRKWGWATLHAPMPSAASFTRLKKEEWRNILKLVRGEMIDYPAGQKKMRWMTEPPSRAITGELVGGNLSLWQSLVGTPWSPTTGKGKILFFEDVDEKLYRLDRMIVQISQAGLLDGAAAMVLGDFTDCNDESNTCLAPCQGAVLKKAIANPTKAQRQPLRKTFSTEHGLREIFVPVCERLRIPLIKGLPVGHGPGYFPLPLGGTYELSADGRLQLMSWNWAR